MFVNKPQTPEEMMLAHLTNLKRGVDDLDRDIEQHDQQAQESRTQRAEYLMAIEEVQQALDHQVTRVRSIPTKASR